MLGVSGNGGKVVNDASTKTGDVAAGPPTAPGADRPDPPSDKSVKMELRGRVVSKGKIVHQKRASGGSQVGVIPKVVNQIVEDEDDDGTFGWQDFYSFVWEYLLIFCRHP